jgi:hypothetical protein
MIMFYFDKIKILVFLIFTYVVRLFLMIEFYNSLCIYRSILHQ